MSSPQFIYNLIAMSDAYIEAWTRFRDKESEYEKMTPEERKEHRKNYVHVPDPEMSLGKAYRGSFLDLEKLIGIIESQDDPYGICECYYTYLLIERIHPDCIDSIDWENGEVWYKMDENYQYKRIEKPDCFRQTCNFT